MNFLRAIFALVLSYNALSCVKPKWTTRLATRGVLLRSTLSDTALSINSDKPGVKIEQDAEENLLNHAFIVLCSEEDPEKFVATLKLWASKRASLTNQEKLALIKSAISHMDILNSDLLSSCIWSLGIIGYSVDHVFKHSNDLNTGLSPEMLPLSNRISSSMMVHVNRVLSSSPSTEIACRVMGGLSKMGYQWSTLPTPLKESIVELLLNYNNKNSNICENGDNQGKDIAIICYTLGQLKARKRDISHEGIKALLCRFEDALRLKSMTNQGLVNSLHGLQRMGLTWDEDVASGLRYIILDAALNAAETLRRDELCSLICSLANLKLSWDNSIPSELQKAISDALIKHSPSLSNREIANALWALGNLKYPYKAGGGLETALGDALVRRANTFNQFDVESIFVGLGLMGASFKALPMEAQAGLLRQVSTQVETMNVFKLYNVLWGMANVGLTVDSPVLSRETSLKLWDRTMNLFHSFLRRHYGEVMWAISSLGFTFGDNSLLSKTEKKDKKQMLAILTRVFPNLDTRGAAYVLRGLAKMGFQWERDMSAEILLPSYKEPVEPMAKIVSLYLKRQNFREHDYAVLLSSMGALGVRFHDNLSSGIVVKLSRVAPYVSSHFSSQSLSCALQGLATCGVVWREMAGGEEVRQAYYAAMLMGENRYEGEAGMRSCDERKPQGICGMSVAQLTDTLDSLAQMDVNWSEDLPYPVQVRIHEVLKRDHHYLGCYEDKVSAALGSMKCPHLFSSI